MGKSRTFNNITPRPYVVDAKSLDRTAGYQINWDRVPESFRQGEAAVVTVGSGGASSSDTSVPVSVVFKNGHTVIPVGAVLDFGGGKFARLSAPYTSGVTITVDALPTALVENDAATWFENGDAGKKIIRGGTVVCLDGPTVTVSAAAGSSNVGNGTIGTVSATSAAKPGVYTLTVVEPGSNAGIISVEDPQGKTVGDATVGSAATVDGVTFTVADGSTDFAAGDLFTIEVSVSEASKSGKILPRSTGRGKAIGILEQDAVEDDRSASLTGYGVLAGGVLYENMLPDSVSGELPESYKQELAAAGTGFAYQRYQDGRSSLALS